jgi:dTDP-glucose pyrophosphorylase
VLHIDDDRVHGLLVQPGASVREAMQRIDEGGLEIALMVDGDGRLLGTLTDGDLRRALLAGAELGDPVDPYVSTDPITVKRGLDRAAALDLMRARSIAQLPQIDGEGRLTGLHLLRDILGPPTLPNQAVVLAGGRGSRLGELTRNVPKPMLKVAGRPILERLLLHLVGSGIRRVALSIGYLGDQIEAHFGDGSAHGCEITYLRESPEQPLGTGGPLRLLLEQDRPPELPVLAMNGDLLTTFSVSGMLEAHTSAGAALTLGVQEYVHEVPFGVVHADEHTGRVQRLDEKPACAWTVNAGTYVVAPSLLERIPPGEPFPITDLVEGCLDREEHVIGWRMDGDWQDIGRPRELRAARRGR